MNTAPLEAIPYRRYGAGDGYPFAIRNYWLRVLLAIWDKMACLLTCTEEDADLESTEVFTVGSGVALALRERKNLARKTVVHNYGAVKLDIYEAGCLVLTVPAGATLALPRTGKLALAGLAHSSTTTAMVTTFIRCACGAEDYEQSSDSIGAHLL